MIGPNAPELTTDLSLTIVASGTLRKHAITAPEALVGKPAVAPAAAAAAAVPPLPMARLQLVSFTIAANVASASGRPAVTHVPNAPEDIAAVLNSPKD